MSVAQSFSLGDTRWRSFRRGRLAQEVDFGEFAFEALAKHGTCRVVWSNGNTLEGRRAVKCRLLQLPSR